MAKRMIALLLSLTLLLGGLVGARADDAMTSEEALLAFRAFRENAAGRYVAQLDGDLVVLELTPAFGKLFASVAYYMAGESLYSYYAATLAPGDLTRAENRAGNSESSFLLTVRSYSNMSNAGDYWPGEAKQRFTLTAEGLEISEFDGNGEALVSSEDIAFLESADAPTVLCYGPDDVAMIYDIDARVDAPDAFLGAWSATWRWDGIDCVSRMALDKDGMMTLLLTPFDGRPPRLMRGGYALLPMEDGAFALHFVLSDIASGTMPIAGSARLALDGSALTAGALALENGYTDDCQLVPDGEAEVAYERGENPMRLVWMTLADERNGESFFDVTARDPFTGEEEMLTVLKDGGTLFGWSTGKKTLDKFALWGAITSGRPVPVLCHVTPWSSVDTLLVLDDIAEDTEVLAVRAPYFAALRDYVEWTDDGRHGSEASVFFGEGGEPTIYLSNRTDYEVQRDMEATITRRVGSVFTAVDEAGDAVTFEIQPYGWLVILEQRLSFATHGFPGFGEQFYQKTE